MLLKSKAKQSTYLNLGRFSAVTFCFEYIEICFQVCWKQNVSLRKIYSHKTSYGKSVKTLDGFLARKRLAPETCVSVPYSSFHYVSSHGHIPCSYLSSFRNTLKTSLFLNQSRLGASQQKRQWKFAFSEDEDKMFSRILILGLRKFKIAVAKETFPGAYERGPRNSKGVLGESEERMVNRSWKVRKISNGCWK